MKQLPYAILAWLLLAVVLVTFWSPMGFERRKGGKREYLGVTGAVALAWNEHNLSLRGDETIVFNRRLALVIEPWVVLPVFMTMAAVYVAVRLLKIGRYRPIE